MKLSVIVPTYRRTADLARCIAALDAQQRRVDEVIVIVRTEDTDAIAWLRARGALERGAAGRRADAGIVDLRVEFLTQPGVVAAYNRGIDSATGDLVCFTDDDAAPHADWTARIEAAFARERALGGIGGRDIVHERNTILTGQQQRVGLVRWYGRAIGNHHIGCGAPREVQVLKGVNMAFRREAIGTLRFDRRLRGNGAQVHCEMAFCLDVVGRGWKLVYDPDLLVEHYPAVRGDEDQRHRFNATAFYNASYNLRLIMCEHLSSLGRWAFVAYVTLIGNRADPGLARALTLAAGGESITLALRKWWVGLRAMHRAWHEAIR